MVNYLLLVNVYLMYSTHYIFNMVNEVKVRRSSGNMLTNEKVECLVDATCRPIYEKRIRGMTIRI